MSNKKKAIEDYFDFLAEDYFQHKYSGKKRSYMSVRQDLMLSFLKRDFDIKNKIILDAGCGPGLLISELLQNKNYVIGIDRSKEMLRLASESLTQIPPNGTFDLSLADIEKIPFLDNSFDIVSTAGVIEYLDDDDDVLMEFNRILKKDGILLISVTNRYSYNLIFDTLLEALIKNKTLFPILNYMNIKIGNGKLQQKKFAIRKHSPFDFKKKIKRNGFSIIHTEFFYFLPFPHPFDKFFFRTCDFIGSIMEKFGKTKLGIMGEGFFLVCRK